MDREQLEVLRRQVEEEYKLDVAAIERLQRRYPGVTSAVPGSAPSNSIPLRAHSSQIEWSSVDSRIEPPAPVSAPSMPVERQGDELVSSLRTMFTTAGRK